MLTETSTSDSQNCTEYAVYTFPIENSGRWQKFRSFRKKRLAVALARRLFKSGQYEKIEIKKQQILPETREQLNCTLHVIGSKNAAKKNLIAPLIGLACGILIFSGFIFWT